MNTAWKVAPVAVLVTLTACTTHRITRETVREQPIVQQQPVIERERTIVQQQPVVERERVVVVQQPAPPAEAQPPAPAATGYSWVAGYYEFRDGAWIWRPGRWIAGTIRPMPPLTQESMTPAPSAGARWVPGHWTFAGNDWVWISGRWL
jgi:hypothetical protein